MIRHTTFITGFLALMLMFVLTVSGQKGYFLGGTGTECWEKRIDSNITVMLTDGCHKDENGTPLLFIEWTVPPSKVGMVEGMEYLIAFKTHVGYTNFTTKYQVDHMNVHACRSESSVCSPDIMEMPDLVTHTPEEWSDLDSNNTAWYNTTEFSLRAGRWTVIAHASVIIGGSPEIQYDFAIGVLEVVVAQATEERKLENVAKYTVLALTAATSLFALVLLILLVCYWKHPIIRYSSPTFCFIVLLGSLFGLASVPMFAYQSAIICPLRIWLLGIAYCLIFGALWVKTWRIFRIFGNPKLKVRVIKDIELLKWLSCILAVEIIVLSIWTAVVQPKRSKVFNEVENFKFFYACSGRLQVVFTVIILIINGSFLLAGVFLAWKTRNVFTLFNESEWIGRIMWNVGITGSICLAIQFTLDFQPTVVFIIRSMGILLIIGFTMGFLFIPKFLTIFTTSPEKLRTLQAQLHEISVPSTPAVGTITSITDNNCIAYKGRLKKGREEELQNLSESVTSLLRTHRIGKTISDKQIKEFNKSMNTLAQYPTETL